MSAGTIAFPWGRPAALGRVGRAGRALRRYPIAYLGVAIVVLVVAVALLADVITPYDPAWQIDERLTPPNADYVLGLDEFGRDVYSRIIYGTRVSLYVGIVSVLVILCSEVPLVRRSYTIQALRSSIVHTYPAAPAETWFQN